MPGECRRDYIEVGASLLVCCGAQTPIREGGQRKQMSRQTLSPDPEIGANAEGTTAHTRSGEAANLHRPARLRDGSHVSFPLSPRP